jgi:hypothetical protein
VTTNKTKLKARRETIKRRTVKIDGKIDRMALLKDDPKIAAMFREATTAPKGTNQHTDNVSTLKPETRHLARLHAGSA